MGSLFFVCSLITPITTVFHQMLTCEVLSYKKIPPILGVVFSVYYKLPQIMRHQHLFTLLFFVLLPWASVAQFADDFTDGNFTADPVWSGNTSIFTVVGGELRNNDTGAGTSYLSTPSTATNEWVFRVKMTYNPSSSNYSRVYLMSDNADLSAAVLKGYYVEFGRSGDDIDLVKQNDATRTVIIAGSGGVMNASSNNIRVRVTRSGSGNWTLKADLTGGTNFSTNIGAVTDNDFTTSTHFGVYCVYTSTRKDKIFFDNIAVSQPPQINTTNATSVTQLDVTFNEEVDQTTAETASNYSVNNGVGNAATATLDGTNKALVHLTFSNGFATSNTLTVNNVADLFGNTITTAQTSNFSIDIAPPTIANVQVLSATAVEVTFNENVDQTTAETLTNYSLNNGIGNPATATLDGSNKALVHLTLGSSLTDLTNYTLTIENVKDLANNAITSTSQGFQYLAPYTPSQRDIVINEIFADPSPQVGLPEVEFVELFNATNRPIDITGWKLDGVNTSGFPAFVLKSGGFVVLTSPGNEGLFSGNVLSWGGSGTLTNGGEVLTLTNASDQLVDRVNYSDEWYNDNNKSNGGYSLEQINPTTRCTGTNNWTASSSASGGTPGAQNSVFDTTPDQKAPTINLASLKNDSTLAIQFSEPMDSVKLKTAVHYSFDNGLTVKSVTAIAPAYTVVEVQFSGSLQTGVAYTITTANLTDCIGNALSGTTARFGKGATPAYHELVITELMADPSPTIGLPEREFVEILNRSNKVIELKGVLLTDGSDTAIVANQTSVFPGEYLILTTSSAVDDLSFFGRALGISNFPSLANSGELLVLRNAAGHLLHSVHYLDSWYQDDTKKDGGYTLEMIDTGNPCGELDNWKAATATVGGTPGKVNSVKAANPDQNAPQILKAEAFIKDTITVTFNEKMDSTSLANATYALSNGASVASIEIISPEFKQVKLKVATDLQLKTVYTLIVNNVLDCSGNTIANKNSTTFAVTEQGDATDIVLNEVLFNPRTGGVDFVEIYNVSDKFINLKDWKLANVDSDGNVANQKAMTTENNVLPPQHYRILTTDKANIQSNYPKAPDSTFLVMPTLPGYNDDEGSVILINNEGKLMQRFDYKDDFHFSLIDDKNGVSLERIRFTALTNTPNSWHSAASSEGFATPGYRNSQTRTDGVGDPVSLDFSAITPNGDGDRDFTTINYKFAQSGITISLTVFDKYGRKIKTLAQNDLAATEGFYTWDGTNDAGQKAGMGYYIIYIETFALNGEKKRYKKPIVVGARF